MNENFYMTIPSSTTVFDLPDNHPAKKVAINARRAQARNMNAENTLINSTYRLTPFQQQLALEDERFRKQLMLHREKEESRRRQLIERNTYDAIGSIASSTGRGFVKSLLF